MFRLIGQIESVEQEFIDGPFESHFEEECVALFSSREAAERYIRSAKLGRVIRESFSGVR